MTTNWQTRRIVLPLFGECRLKLEALDSKPAFPVAYVQLQDQPDNLKSAVWRAGEWRTRGGRPFRAAVVGWYSIVRPDGSPVF
ncbi:hypothetical protein [Novosphingobium sp.]|uniref:hypothetical protein n=1 Tax=Novosphingobium sp. TaxID=1874826 RepID=UPI0025E1F0AA|nr:hypothetical protein [Novosphingobium sp.]